MSSPTKEKEKDPDKDTTWFLINCIMHSEVGKIEKIDWEAVAQKMNVPSKGAAQMRYHRLLASYGLNRAYTSQAEQVSGSNHAENGTNEPSTIPKRKRKSNKRKRPDTMTQDLADDIENKIKLAPEGEAQFETA